MGQYTYRVLRQIAPDEVPEDAVLFIDCGEHDGKTPDAAALTAAGAAKTQGDYRAISARHFNDVPIVPQTGFMVGERSAVAAPPPPVGDAPCAWPEGCGHTPDQHGSDGVGMCLVSDCPCEKYTPPEAGS